MLRLLRIVVGLAAVAMPSEPLATVARLADAVFNEVTAGSVSV